MNEIEFKSAIAEILNCNKEQIFFYWKGRVALYAILKAMNIKKGDEVIVPAFTCVVVPNAILYLNAKPVYVDICAENYNMDIQLLEMAITSKTKVIMCQNTFGLSSNVEEIVQVAKKHNLFTIEDCTHGFGGYYKGKPNGSYCDAAFYSTQWNKPFSTGIGGFLVVNNENLLDEVTFLEGQKVMPTIKEKMFLKVLIFANRLLINQYSYWSLLRIYRFLSRHNLVIGSNRGEELAEIKMPENYFKDVSSVQIKAGIRELKKLNSINLLRKKNAIDYTQLLKAKNRTYVDENLFDDHLFLKYPILVRDRERFFQLAEKEKINLGDWFLSPLHPVVKNLERWGLDRKLFPIADRISKKTVNLPTGTKNNTKVMDFVIKNLELVE